MKILDFISITQKNIVSALPTSISASVNDHLEMGLVNTSIEEPPASRKMELLNTLHRRFAHCSAKYLREIMKKVICIPLIKFSDDVFATC